VGKCVFLLIDGFVKFFFIVVNLVIVGYNLIFPKGHFPEACDGDHTNIFFKSPSENKSKNMTHTTLWNEETNNNNNNLNIHNPVRYGTVRNEQKQKKNKFVPIRCVGKQTVTIMSHHAFYFVIKCVG
jgi:hypothetical protein